MPPSFYLLHGPDQFAAAELVAEIKSKMGDPATASLSTTVFEGRTVTLSDLKSVCDTLPFLTPRRLVVVEGWLSKLMARSEGEADGEEEALPASATAKETLAAIVDYLPNLPASTALVFTESRTLHEKHPVLRAARGQPWAHIRLLEMPAGTALAAWIQKRAHAQGGDFTSAAADALAAQENDPRALDQEITKLLTYAAFARPVDVADVEALTPAGGEDNVFKLTDAIGRKNARDASRVLQQLLDTQEPLRVFGMIVGHFRRLLQAKELLASRASQEDVARRLNLHRYPAQIACEQSVNFELAELEHIYHRLLDYDVAIKTGRMEAATALEALVTGLTT
jgi:DNA polymerase-3 subunit delta